MKKSLLAIAFATMACAVNAQQQDLPVDGKLESVVDASGKVNREAYLKAASAWGPISQNSRLGPSFEDLNPNATEDRPTNFKPESKPCAISFANRCNPYELGRDGCKMDNDYWSDSGQVAYVPNNMHDDPGLDRVQTFAYYNHVFALSPRLDYASGKPHPEPQTREKDYVKLDGHTLRYPVAMERNYGMLQNEELIVYRDGFFGVAGTQTSRAGNERPFPGIVFPKNKVPMGVAVTTQNEFALVPVWDTDAMHGQLAVIALEAKYLKFHTWPYMGLPNQGSFSDFKLLGYVDLPMAAPTSVAAASNGWWGGPSQTGGKVLSQIDLANAGTRHGMDKGDMGWASVISTKGYAIVASKDENKAAIVDLTPLLSYVRESYLSSQESFDETTKNKGQGPGQWPATFAEKPEITPKVIWQMDVPRPTAVLAGLRIDRWSQDRFKAYVASEDGTISIIDASPLMARWSWERRGKLGVMGTFKVGRNPVAMIFLRFGGSTAPIGPANLAGDPLNNLLWIACRGDREIVHAATWGAKGGIVRVIKDTRMGDPVGLSVASRGNILSVADFNGKKLISYRIGPITDRYKVHYGCGEDGKAWFEVGGELSVEGKPFLINSVNVN